MNDFNNNDDSRLEKLQKDLYSKGFKQKESDRHNLDPKEYSLGDDWVEEEIPQEKTKPDLSDLIEEEKKSFGFFSYVMIFAALFFIGSVSYAAFVFLGGSQTISANAVDINISGPVSVGAGEVLSLDLIIQNNNPVPIEAVDLIIEYPRGTKSAENLIDPLNRTRERVEDIDSGTITRKTLNAALFGDEGDNKEISIIIEYQVTGSNAIFSKEKVFSVVLNAAPARISISGLKEVSSGQEIEIEAKVTSNSVSELKNLMVTASYPFGFKFIDSDIDPTYSNNIWVFDSMAPNEEKTIKIKGTITGQNEEERVFRFNTGLVSEEDEREIGIIFNNYVYDVLVKKPFVGLAMNINGSIEPIVSANSGETIQTELIFSNNTNDIIRNLDMRLKIEGFIFDESTVSAKQGFYRSADNTLVFNSETNSKLEQINARDELRTSFRFDIKDLINSGIDITNPEVKITAFLEGDRISDNNVEEKISETSVKLVKIISDVFLGSYTIRDIGPFENTGPIPPVAENETTYTLTWSVSNNSNNLENVRITANLPQYVLWNNKVSPSDENYSYDEKSRLLVWNIGNIKAGVGNTSDPKELSFNVTLFPSLSQVGDVPNLLRNVLFTARDTFTETDIEIIGSIPTTELSEGSPIKNHKTVVE